MTKNSDRAVDSQGVRAFWEERAKRFVGKDLVNLSNLESDVALARVKHREECRVLEDFIAPKKQDLLLDLGAGHGAWAAYFARQVSFVDCVEYSEGMASIARDHFRENGILNTAVHCIPAQDFIFEKSYDVILISGLMIYLNDEDAACLTRSIRNGLKHGGRVVLRDGTAKEEPYTIVNRYSEELDAYYSAHYRTSEEYIQLFSDHGLKLLRHQNMFADGSPLNKRKETILRIYEFQGVADE